MEENNKSNNYFVPEQLDDNDFEREKSEAKKARKNKKIELNKNQIIKIVLIVTIVVLICAGIYLYLNPIQKKDTLPEQMAKTFCAYFNSGNWKKLNKLMDFKGYYILNVVLDEADYTKFDKTYKKLDTKTESYEQYETAIDILTSIDEETLDMYGNVQIKLRNIEACNIIQGTDTLYKLRVNFDYIYEGQSENITDVIFISNASGEYKIVYGEWMQTVLNYYQSIYMIQSNYGY